MPRCDPCEEEFSWTDHFAQERIGLGNKPFKMYKFRSMGVQDPKKEAKEWTTKNDVRVTPVGRVIRKTSLDELPQFWNVY